MCSSPGINAKLDDATEQAIAAVCATNQLIDVKVRWKDTGETEYSTVKIGGDDVEDSLYFCDGVDDFRGLIKDDGNADFIVIGFSDGTTNWGTHAV